MTASTFRDDAKGEECAFFLEAITRILPGTYEIKNARIVTKELIGSLNRRERRVGRSKEVHVMEIFILLKSGKLSDWAFAAMK